MRLKKKKFLFTCCFFFFLHMIHTFFTSDFFFFFYTINLFSGLIYLYMINLYLHAWFFNDSFVFSCDFVCTNDLIIFYIWKRKYYSFTQVFFFSNVGSRLLKSDKIFLHNVFIIHLFSNAFCHDDIFSPNSQI